MPLSGHSPADVMYLGRGIGMDVLDLPATSAGADGTPFQALDRSPRVPTQHAPKIHGHQLPSPRAEARRRALPLLVPATNLQLPSL